MVALVFDHNSALVAVRSQLIKSAFFGESLNNSITIPN
jgi:hypothetical protein